MGKKALDEIIRHQNDTQYDSCRYNGRLNVAECLEHQGIKPVGGYYSITGYAFPDVPYNRLDFFDIAFTQSDFAAAHLTGARFDACLLSPPPADLSGAHLANMLIQSPSIHFVGTRFTNCTSHGFSSGDFTNALIESDGKSLGHFFDMQSAGGFFLLPRGNLMLT
ncbi:MAG: hypothetical protein M3R00_06040 [Pseudomonadota bacterium]|nr:hypothetical protein [Pseudomonadota bacterium]